MLSETCTSQGLSKVKKETCHNSVIYDLVSKFITLIIISHQLKAFYVVFFVDSQNFLILLKMSSGT